MTEASFPDRMRAWAGEQLVVRHDGPSGAWMLIGVHSTALGPAMGGTRLKVYGSFEQAVGDTLRLARAMTFKQAAAGLPFGGGKGVLGVPAVPPPGSAERCDLLRRYGDLVESLGGTYVTAADMNTGSRDLDVIAERTSHVLGRSAERGGSGDTGADTAAGVFHGIRAACAHAFGSGELAGRSVLVQGVGSVGVPLVEMLHRAGAEITVTDIDLDRAVASVGTMAATVPPDQAFTVPCDVFAPCATGGVLSAATIPLLRCRVVAGAANNQLAEPGDARRLSEAGILYAPDYIVNAGGVIHLAGYEALGWDEAAVRAHLAGIEHTLAEVFTIAERDGLTTAEAADRLALARIAAA